MGCFIGEFFGTMVLILLGDGVVAGVVLARTKSHNAGWIVITAGWAFAVMAGVFTSKALGGPGAINPVGPVTDIVMGALPDGPIANLLRGAPPPIDPAAYHKKAGDCLARIAGEFLGAFVGAMLVWLHYLPHWKETEDPLTKLAVFCTGPAIRSPGLNLVSEMIGTFVLVFVASAMGKAAAGKALDPVLVGALVWAIGLSLGGTTGYAINPARDFSPRLAHFILPIPGKGSSEWGYAWIPVIGPLLGGLFAAGLFNALVPYVSSAPVAGP